MKKQQQQSLINESSFSKILKPISRLIKKESTPTISKEFISPYAVRQIRNLNHNVQVSILFDCLSELEDYIQRQQPISKLCAKRIKHLLKKQGRNCQQENFIQFRQKTEEISEPNEKVQFEVSNPIIYEIENIQFKMRKKTVKANKSMRNDGSELTFYKQSYQKLNCRVLELQQLNEKLMQQIKINESNRAELTIKLAAIQLNQVQMNKNLQLYLKEKESFQLLYIGETKKLQLEKTQSAFKIKVLQEVLVQREQELVNLWTLSL